MEKEIPSLEHRFSKENMTAYQAQALAHWISQGPIVFQVARTMISLGILEFVSASREGVTLEEASDATGVSLYGVKVLMESALAMGILLYADGRYTCSKAGWFLLNDPMVRVNMDFNHHVNYLGMYSMEEAIKEGRPAGLGVFGPWKTIYEGLSKLPEDASRSWFAFDHYYSDNSFDQALQILFSTPGGRILDVGGNTGRFALKAVSFSDCAHVTVMDLPTQIEMMCRNVAGCDGSSRIHSFPADLLDESVAFPKGFDKIWMSQFLDCFSEPQAVSILSRAARSMDDDTRLYIMESFWDRQVYDTAVFALAQISLYFTVMANGNSKMYGMDDMLRCISQAGLEVESATDNIGECHTLIVCKRRKV